MRIGSELFEVQPKCNLQKQKKAPFLPLEITLHSQTADAMEKYPKTPIRVSVPCFFESERAMQTIFVDFFENRARSRNEACASFPH